MLKAQYCYDKLLFPTLMELAKSIKPIGKNGTVSYDLSSNLDQHLQNSYSYTFNINKWPTTQETNLVKLAEYSLPFSWAYYGFVKPSWGEALSHIHALRDELEISKVYGVELHTHRAYIYNGPDIKGQSNYHIIPVTIWGKEPFKLELKEFPMRFDY